MLTAIKSILYSKCMNDQFIEYDFMAAEGAETGESSPFLFCLHPAGGVGVVLYMCPPRENVSSTGTYVYY